MKGPWLCNSEESQRGIIERKHSTHFLKVNRLRLTANTKSEAEVWSTHEEEPGKSTNLPSPTTIGTPDSESEIRIH